MSIKLWFTSAILSLILISCEKDYAPGPNYMYDFSALVYKDQWGIETWGGHQFILDEKIENPEAFKECYVNYLNWSGLDHDGMYKKIYYADPKHVKIKYLSKAYTKFTVKSQDACQ